MLANFIAASSPFGDADGGINWASFPGGILRVSYSFPAGVLVYRLYAAEKLRLPPAPSWAVTALLAILLLARFNATVPLSVIAGFPVVVALAAAAEPKGLLRPAFAALGTASYAIYVIHQPLHTFVFAVLAKTGLQTPDLLIETVLLCGLLPITLLVDRLYDAPVRAALNRKIWESRIPTKSATEA
jgi:peptidoglycan/LPS O-acetylase OafA/YrhL